MRAEVEDFQRFWDNYKTNLPATYGPRVDRYLMWVRSEGAVVDVSTLKLWIVHLSKSGASASYANGYFYAIKAGFLAWNDEESKSLPRVESDLSGWALGRDLAKIKLPKVVRGKRAIMVKEFQLEDLDKVIRCATKRVSTMIEFLADTGLRVAEMTGLRIKDARRFNPEFAFVTVVGKGDKERAVWIHCKLLDRVRDVFGGKVFLFETRSGRPLDPDNVYKQVRSAFHRIAGIALTPHNMRHYCAMRLLAKGASAAGVARHFGHSTPETTATFYDASNVPLEALRTNHHGERGKRKVAQLANV